MQYNKKPKPKVKIKDDYYRGKDTLEVCKPNPTVDSYLQPKARVKENRVAMPYQVG